MTGMPINRFSSSVLFRLNESYRELRKLDGTSVNDAENLPHPAKLFEWSRLEYYEIDADRGVFRLTQKGREVSA